MVSISFTCISKLQKSIFITWGRRVW